MSSCSRASVWLLVLVHAAAGGAEAQQRRAAPMIEAGWPSSDAAPADAGAVGLLSLGLPGAGQHVLGKRRKWLYLAAEVVGWTLYLERRAAGGRYRDEYRDFAWEHARLQEGPRVEGDFEYYETLSHWASSGTFDSDPRAPGLQPEPDGGTFNGSVWALARQIHLGGGDAGADGPDAPGYEAALAYYRERAYGPPFLWNWAAAPGGQAELIRLIGESDDRFRQATTVLGAVLANHLISAVDAYVSARGLAPATGLRVSPEGDGGGGRWRVQWSLPLL